MIVFHGSDREIQHPDTLHSRKKVDFGPGFYVTPLEEQAKGWVKKFLRHGSKGVISVYQLDEAAFSQIKISIKPFSKVVACLQADDRRAGAPPKVPEVFALAKKRVL